MENPVHFNCVRASERRAFISPLVARKALERAAYRAFVAKSFDEYIHDPITEKLEGRIIHPVKDRYP